MARIIPNNNSFIGFVAGAVTSGNISGSAGAWAPTAAQIVSAVNLTPFVISLNATTQGNVLPIPAFDSLFESTTIGTTAGTFTGDYYRDDTVDTAWTTLAKTTVGFMCISRFGGTGTNKRPTTGQKVDIWPIVVVSRAASQLSNNTVQIFTASCAITAEPTEYVTVA